jgi:hypothetical protein
MVILSLFCVKRRPLIRLYYFLVSNFGRENRIVKIHKHQLVAAGAQYVRLPDDRYLCYYEYGSRTGQPIFFFHGFLTTGEIFRLWHDLFVQLNIRAICPTLPGWGLSDVVIDRQVEDWPRDLEHLAQHIGVEGSFGVVGVCFGGMHALACAALLPHRVSACAVFGGHAPFVPTRLLGAHSQNDQENMWKIKRKEREKLKGKEIEGIGKGKGKGKGKGNGVCKENEEQSKGKRKETNEEDEKMEDKTETMKDEKNGRGGSYSDDWNESVEKQSHKVSSQEEIVNTNFFGSTNNNHSERTVYSEIEEKLKENENISETEQDKLPDKKTVLAKTTPVEQVLKFPLKGMSMNMRRLYFLAKTFCGVNRREKGTVASSGDKISGGCGQGDGGGGTGGTRPQRFVVSGDLVLRLVAGITGYAVCKDASVLVKKALRAFTEDEMQVWQTSPFQPDEFVSSYSHVMRESMSYNTYGFVDAVKIIALKPWGFDLREISTHIPVYITSTENDDVTPARMQRFLCKWIVHSKAGLWPGRHIMHYICFDQMLTAFMSITRNNNIPQQEE